ncbi:MAG: putative 4-hydroxybenzoate polyprenyltransferase [Bacteroidota bacterium]|nr:putative 4-hydroxybenzoate polyprenyltransferase [Bacteroidota bacterium]
MVKSYLSLIKFSHTVFALPFALIGFFIGIHTKGFEGLDWTTLILVLFCMVTARSAAMAFNRWADQEFDKHNPRTAIREIPIGTISSRSALLFVLINTVLFMAFAYWINFLCFLLSPLALVIILGYSYTKRFSWLCHVFLGLGLSLAPVGAYLAVTQRFDILPILYGAAVITWVAGFDIVYALQDIDFDEHEKLKSIPVKFGISKSLFISSILHTFTAIFIISSAYILYADYGLSFWMFLSSFCFLALLFYQHLLLSKFNVENINLAFFTTNGLASIILAIGTILDFYI